MVTGSCLCGDIRFEVDEAGTELGHCHCSMCRKAHGTGFVTWLEVKPAGFRWTAGEERVARYRSSATMTRAFCPRCGSALPDFDRHGASVPAGLLDGDPGVRPSRHIFWGSRAPWLAVVDDLPKYEAYQPGNDAAVYDAPAPQAPHAGGVMHGSCLCQAVRFEVSEAFGAVFNCHCGRCRKARAAAHATNGFVGMDSVRFVSGADAIVEYKVPEAKYFTQAFCRHCGSAVPRISAERGVAVVPFGSLDDQPATGAGAHIYTAYKAPWFTIGEDGCRRFEEGPG